MRSDPNADVSALSWRDFEALVGEGFRHRGFAVTERGGGGSDGGVDLALVFLGMGGFPNLGAGASTVAVKVLSIKAREGCEATVRVLRAAPEPLYRRH